MSKFYVEKPKQLDVGVEVSTVFMECEGKILLLQRASHKKIAPNLWAVPGGKLEHKETPLEGLVREIKEELALSPPPEVLIYKHSFYVEHKIVNYRLHLFQWIVNKIPKIILHQEEHQNCVWQPIEQFHTLPLLEGQLEAFHSLYTSC